MNEAMILALFTVLYTLRRSNHLIGTQKGGTWTTAVEGWHVYEIIWSEEKIEFVFDGLKYFEFVKLADATYKEWPFDKEFRLILNIVVSIHYTGVKQKKVMLMAQTNEGIVC